MKQYSKIIFFFGWVLILALVSCEKNLPENTTTNIVNEFGEVVEVENSEIKYFAGDTIWFSADINNELVDKKSGEVITLENQTFVISGLINLLNPKYDSLDFLQENFDLISDIGDIKLVNVLNKMPQTYAFDILFGRPLATNMVRFGLVLNYPGVYAVEYEGIAYFGPERTDYMDYSIDNEKGYIDFQFNADNINSQIYDSLPEYYRYYYYDSYYTYSDISRNKFYFFEVDND